MDWYVPNDRSAASELRREFADYLGRHAAPGSDLEGAKLIFAELVTNAIDNSERPVWVSLVWAAEQPVLTVHDLGPGFELPEDDAMPSPSSVRGRGLKLVTHLTDRLEVAAKAAGGSSVEAALPVRRARSAHIDPPPAATHQLLPAPEELDEHGRYGREPFLRALAVQLAQTVERESGPDTAEAYVASVGAGIGYRMEQAFRKERGIDDRQLTGDELGVLFVSLKQGIGGDFFVIDADDDRIVLGNHHCPFGEAVTHAPALCRMTSSVFGGITARNRGKAAVHLEERIAVGDPGCRVTVWLRQPPPEIEAQVHVYRRHDDPS